MTSLESWELERQRAWVRFAGAISSTSNFSGKEAATYADWMLKQWEERFPKPE